MSRTLPWECKKCDGVIDWGDFGPSGNDPDYAIEDKPTCTCCEWEWTGDYWREVTPPPAPSPYRFTVSVDHSEGNVFTWWAVNLNEYGLPVRSEHLSEAEARSHAVRVLAALHQATMEETP